MNLDRLDQLFYYDNGLLRYKKPVGLRNAGDVAGNKLNKGYWQVGVDRKRYLAHRVIFALHHRRIPGQIDHINGDKCDNRIENLREVDNAQNQWNTGLRSTNKSGVKGVYWHKGIKRWVASCRHGGKQHIVGTYNDLQAAAESIAAYRLAHHGQFAKHATNGIGEQHE